MIFMASRTSGATSAPRACGALASGDLERGLQGVRDMALPVRGDRDERFNELNDSDALWGPFGSFRPAKQQRFTGLRALAMAVVFGGVYGLGLNLVLALSCGGIARLPSVYAMPFVLGLTCFVGFQSTLGPAWNRRAHWLNRRADYLTAVSRER
jgi:hypothetical protein